MSRTFLYALLFLFFHVSQAVPDMKFNDGMVIYESARMRDNTEMFDDSSEDLRVQRRRRPKPGGGGSRYLRRNRPRKPGKKNLNKSNLLALLGDDYKTTWMSDEKPKKMFSVPAEEIKLDDEPQWAYKRHLEQLNEEYNVSAELKKMAPDLLPYESQIKKWLVKRATCPIEYSWKDLGPTYWPRYIRNGECVNRDGYCSYPKGMHCVPGYTTTVQILLWGCNEGKKRHRRGTMSHTSSVLYKNRVPPLGPGKKIKKKKKCDWKKVPHPITIDCYCTC